MKNIKAKDVSVLLQENKAILIDVRETFEYNSIHIDGAIRKKRFNLYRKR